VGGISAHHRAADALAGIFIPDLRVQARLWNAQTSTLRAVPVCVVIAIISGTNALTFFNAEDVSLIAECWLTLAFACLRVEVEALIADRWSALAAARELIEVLAGDASLHLAVAVSSRIIESETLTAMFLFISAGTII